MNLLHLQQGANLDAVPPTLVFEYLSVSIGLGTILMIIAVISSRQVGNVLGKQHGAMKENKMLPKLPPLTPATASEPQQIPDAAANAPMAITVGEPTGSMLEPEQEEIPKVSYAELLLGSANVLFLCFGMTGIMILVNNNLARAFAIGAAIAVVRFRIKFNSQGSMLFFGVLVGMACGVGQIATAVGVTVAYAILQAVVIVLMSIAAKKELKEKVTELIA